MGGTWGHSTVPDCIMLKTLAVLTVLAGLTNAGHPVCKIIWEDKCWDEPREQCSSVSVPYTTTEYEEKCTKKYEQECTYKDEEVCRKVNKENCDLIDDEVCESSADTKVDYVTKNKCYLDHEEKCFDWDE